MRVRFIQSPSVESMPDHKSVLNIEIASIASSEFISSELKGIIFTPNVDHLIKLQKDSKFYACYQKADWVICDSKIISVASKFLGSPIKEVIPGSDLFPEYCKKVAAEKSNGRKVFILGGTTPEITKKAVNNLRNYSIHDFIVGAYCPPFGFEQNENEKKHIIDLIQRSGANVLAMGVGAPKQEKFIIEIKDSLNEVDTYFAIGATIDFISGDLKRAPKWVQKIGFEWFYRMLMDPKRLVKRYLVDDLPFFWLVLKQKLGIYKNPFQN